MSPVDTLWILISTALVLFMQAGFLFLEAGLTRAKNSINVAVKNIVDLGFSLLLFWLIGFGLMFGVGGGWFGFSDFALDIASASPDTAVFFIFQAVFAGTTVTIISGAIAERTSFRAYLGLVGLMAVVYPIVGHWVWGGGWLAERGFVDFAGSTVVHATGGWAALIAASAVGPRLGRFADDGTARPVTPSNLPMAMFGGIVLAVGWIGFNGGSVLALDASVPAVVVHTLFGGAAGLVVSLSLSVFGRGFVAPTAALNGLLGGLVAVTAGAHALPTWAAVVTGAIGGAVAYYGEELLEQVGIDDAVGAVPVHLMAGAWGTLAVGLFGSRDVLGTELSRLDQIGVQLLGIGATSIFTVAAVFVGLQFISAFTPLRVSEEHEIDGLNASEHRTSTALLDLVEQLQRQARTGAIGTALEAEPFTEVGEIAKNYNELTEQLQRTVAVAQSIARGDLAVDVIPKSEQDAFGLAFRAMVSDLRRTVRTINASAAELSQNMASLRTVGAELEQGMADQTEAVSSGLSSFETVRADVAELTAEVAELSQHTNRALDELNGRLTESMSSADAARNGAAQTAATVREGGVRLLEAVGAIEGAAGDIDRVVELVRNVAESTRMLALNAAIEAARAGDAGRSFSIVATEVEVLAMDTLASLGDIESAVARVQAAASDAMTVSDGVVHEAVELSERTASEIEGVEAIVRAEAERSSRVREDFARLGDSMVSRAVILDGEVQVAGGALSTIGSISEATHALVRDLREVENDVGHQATGLGEQLSHFRT